MGTDDVTSEFNAGANMSLVSGTDAEQTFQIISSLRYDPCLAQPFPRNADNYPDPKNSPYYLLAYHRDRLRAAAYHLDGKTRQIGCKEIWKASNHFLMSQFRTEASHGG